MNKNKSAINSSLVLGIGAFISKILGAIYRIPLINIITCEGIGIYQMIFPIYCILLDFAGSGAPNAISKIIAEKNNTIEAKKYLKSSILFFSLLGFIFFIIMLLISYPISVVQGNNKAFIGYVLLSPAVFLVSIISCYRGYFQGLMNMIPTAVSQIIEQLIKLIFGLILTKFFMPNISLAVGGATLAVSISELFALFYLIIKYKRYDKSNIKILISKKEKKYLIKQVVSLTIPFTLIGIAIPFSNFIDSFYIVNILNKYFDNATSVYGIFSGGALTIVLLPVSLCYGISVTAIPYISKNKENKKINHILNFTFVISLIFSIITFFGSKIATNILYRNMSIDEKNLTINLIKILSINVLLLSILQTENAILITIKKKYIPLFSMVIGITIKTIISIILLNDKRFNIYGVCIGLIACYFIAVLINFIVIKRNELNASKEYKNR